MSPLAPAVLELQSIDLSFKGVKAISNISFGVDAGEICALIGPNGAGKSSLLNVISGVYRPQQGRIQLFGRDTTAVSAAAVARLGMARTFQNLALFKGMSVLDNLLAARQVHRKSHWLEQVLRIGRASEDEHRQRRKVEEILELLHLQSLRRAVVGQLPYGIQKRVELARALASEPRLLLLDEPMAGMNAEEKQAMSGYVRDVNQRDGTTVVLIEHDIGVVMSLAQHVVVLDYGRKVGDGTPAEVSANPEVIAAYLGARH